MNSMGRYGLWGFSIALTLALFCLLELGLRLTGNEPGDVSPRWANFRKVDSLEVTNEFLADSNGIMHANPEMAAVWNRDVNAAGFPSVPLSDTSRPSVMMIGDSFLWGMTASNPDSSFAAIVHRETDWTVHNFGIPATDPVQYALVAEHYLPVLQPDALLILFFMGNDLMFHDREVRPFRPQFVVTNAGAIMLDMAEMSFEDVYMAYEYLVAGKYHIQGSSGLLEWLVSRSALLSRLFSIKFRVEEKIQWERNINDLSISNKYLLSIKEVAESNDCAFHIIIIPERKEANMGRERYTRRYSSFLLHPELQPHIVWPQTNKGLFVPYPDAHLNNKGHRTYADFIKQMLGDLEE